MYLISYECQEQCVHTPSVLVIRDPPTVINLSTQEPYHLHIFAWPQPPEQLMSCSSSDPDFSPHFTCEILPKSKIKKEKFKDEVIFGDFEFPEVKKNLPT
jgi:hypothetical protein